MTRTGRVRRLTVIAATAGAVSLGALVTAPLASADAPATIPVAGSFAFTFGQDVTQGFGVGVINAVNRIPGGTVVYYSLGIPAGSKPQPLDPNSLGQVSIGHYAAQDEAYVDVVDPAGLMRYRPMVSGTTCLCSSYGDFPKDVGPELLPGKLYAGYVVVPPLPTSVTSVSVVGFFGAVVSNVPVGNGLLTPVAPDGKSISDLATGWPTVAASLASSVSDPGTFTLPLTKRSASLDNSERTSETPTKVAVDLSSDVLFAVDKSTLTAAAQSRIAAVAADISSRGKGVVTVAGYTDSTGTDSHNQTLSEARAEAVMKALKAAVHGSAVTFTAVGHGEGDPVASNATTSGRSLNRRVTISYSVTKAS